jgi:hypothetical protein
MTSAVTKATAALEESVASILNCDDDDAVKLAALAEPPSILTQAAAGSWKKSGSSCRAPRLVFALYVPCFPFGFWPCAR